MKKTDGRIGVIDMQDGKKTMIWTIKNSQMKARVWRYEIMGKEKKKNPQIGDINKMINIFTNPRARSDLGYQWPKHLNTAFVIELIT